VLAEELHILSERFRLGRLRREQRHAGETQQATKTTSCIHLTILSVCLNPSYALIPSRLVRVMSYCNKT
jgi:hypothetical protein